MGDVHHPRQQDRIRSAGSLKSAPGRLSDEQLVRELAAASRDHDLPRADMLMAEVRGRMLRTRTLAERVQEGAFATDANLVLTFVNPGLARLLGGARERYEGRQAVEALRFEEDGDAATAGNPLETALETRAPLAWNGRLARADGSAVPVEMTVTPLCRHEEVEGLVATLRERAGGEAASQGSDSDDTRLQALLDHLPGGVVVTEAPTGRVVLHNEELVRILGHVPVRLVGEVGPAGPGPLHEDGTPFRAEERPLARALRGEVVKPRLVRYRRADGVVTTFLLSAAPVRDASGAVIEAVGVCQEVDGAPRIQEELRWSEARLESVLGSLREGILVFDRRGEVVSLNAPASESLGLTSDTLRAMRPSNVPLDYRTLEGDPIPPEKTPVGIALYERKPVRDVCLQVTTPHRGGREFIVSAIPTADGGVVASFEDVTEEREATRRLRESQEALRRSEAQYRALVEDSPEPIAVGVGGRFRFINRAGARLFGAGSAEELIGRSILDFVHPDSLALVEERLAALREGKEVPPVEERLVRLDGSLVEVEAVSIPIVYEGEPAVQAIFRDISRRKAHQRELERRVAERTTELKRALQDLETFSESASHDLRAPLRGVGALLDDLLEAAERGEMDEVLALGRLARKENARAQRLVRDLLGFARSGKAELRPVEVDVSALAEEIVRDVEQAHPDRRTSWRIEPGIRVCADPGLLRLALHNLLDNASKYSARTGRSAVRLGRGELDGADVLLVEDNGVGFPMEEAARLFQPFARLSTAQGFEGTGLGLATVHRIAARHGGRVWAESRPGVGTTFHLCLPRTEG